MTIRTVAVVLNGAAGALLDQPDARAELERQFADAGLDAAFVEHDAGTLPERIAQACAAGADAVIVGGGDGTVACAAQALAGTGTVLGVLPFGTMNLLAKDLGIPIGDTPAALAVLAAGRARPIDVAQVNGRVFLCASMLGVPARIGRFREEGRGGPRLAGWRRLAAGFLRTIRRHRPLRVTMHLDERRLPVRASALTITANALADASGPASPSHAFARTSLDGGMLGLYVVRRLTLARVLLLGWRVLRGTWRQDPALQEHAGRKLVVAARGRELTVMNDGELMQLPLPLRYAIRPGALQVIAPSGALQATAP